jgi:hypothetical protein
MTGQLSKGAFRTSQGKGKPLTTLTLMSNDNFRTGCRADVRLLRSGVGAARKRPRRRLFGNAHGRFRTRGRHSTATVRGTKWLTQDTCAGTLTVVDAGSVTVRDLVKHRTRIVRAGHRYLARPKK